MQFVVKGNLVGQQGPRLHPAVAAVTVAVVASMTFTISPSFALRGEVRQGDSAKPAVHAGMPHTAGFMPTGSTANFSRPDGLKRLADRPLAVGLTARPLAAPLPERLVPSQPAPAARVISARRQAPAVPEPLPREPVPAVAASREGTAVITDRRLGRVSALPAEDISGQATATEFLGDREDAGRPGLMPPRLLEPAETRPEGSLRLQDHRAPAVSEDALRWIVAGTADEDDRIFRRQHTGLGLNGEVSSLAADASRTPATSLQAVRTRIEEGLAKRTVPDADSTFSGATERQAVVPAANLAAAPNSAMAATNVSGAGSGGNAGADLPEPSGAADADATPGQALSQLVSAAQDALATRAAIESGAAQGGTRRAPKDTAVRPASDPHEKPVAASYRQTSAGVEVTLPLRVRGAPSGSVTLLIQGARAGHADVVHREFRVSLASLLDALRPDMDPAVYARLRNSRNADELVTLNELRAVGLTIGFDQNGDLTLG